MGKTILNGKVYTSGSVVTPATQAHYNALTDDQKANGIFLITDADSNIDAEDVHYTDTKSVKDELDEVSNSLANLIVYEEFEYSQRTISASSSSIIALTNIEKIGYNIISVTPFVYSTRNRVTCSIGVNTDSTWSIESNVPLVTLKNNATTQENATLKVKVVYKKI